MSLAARGKRTVWGFDSFDKMPVLTAEDEGDGDEWVGHSCSGANGKQEAARTLSRFRLDSDDTHLVAGWFQDTLPQHVDRIVPIAVLRL
ncbi:MAG: hypothetical protein GTO41_03110, partial [Burkholderiales bacterium]|nr:hypothetical protein [Burkholderiales bacterium]